MNTREKAILTGFYLSKFDSDGLKSLGFDSFIEAFNTIGYGLGVKPASIKNYRDEFDPYFPNSRKGWHKRNLRKYCESVMHEFSKHSFVELTTIIKELLVENYQFELFLEEISSKKSNESIAKRLITGKSAEEYFKENYKTIIEFQNYTMLETTHMGCGFDFKLSSIQSYFCIEVKGLSGQKGSIAMTEKEFEIAKTIKNLYCLFVVSNFQEKPKHDLIFNPTESRLSFSKIERPVIQVTYSANF